MPTALPDSAYDTGKDDGQNWGPPPDLNLIHDPGFSEHDSYPYE